MNGAVRRASALENEQLRQITPILNMARGKKGFPCLKLIFPAVYERLFYIIIHSKIFLRFWLAYILRQERTPAYG